MVQHFNARARRGRERGSALLIVVILAFIAMTLIMTSLGEAESSVKYSAGQSRQKRANYAAVAGLNYINDQIAHPFYSGAGVTVTTGYQGSTNLWLQNIKNGYVSSAGAYTTTAPSQTTYASNLSYANTHVSVTNYWIPLFDTSVSLGGTSYPAPTLWVPGTATTPGAPGTPDVPVWCWVNDINLAGDDFLVASYARYPTTGSANYTGGVNTNIKSVWNQPSAPPFEPLVTTTHKYSNESLVIEYVRESVGFSNFMFFAFADDIKVGANCNIAGSIQSNQAIYFPYGGGSNGGTGSNIIAKVSGNVQAHSGVNYYKNSGSTSSGALTLANEASKGISIGGQLNPVAALVGLPAGNLVTALTTTAQGSGAPPSATSYATSGVTGAALSDNNFYTIGGSNYGVTTGATSSVYDTSHTPSTGWGNAGSTWGSLTSPLSVDIEIDNTKNPPVLNITAADSISTHTAVSQTNVPFPSKGVLYVDGSARVHSKDGTFSGSLSIVAGNDHPTSGTIEVTSNIQYVDGSGSGTHNTAFMLTDGTNNYYNTSAFNPASEPSGNWGTAGLNYVQNSAYSSTATSVLGLLAMNNVTMTPRDQTSSNGSATNMIVNANTYAQGYWAPNYSSTSNPVDNWNTLVGSSNAIQNYGHGMDAVTPQVSGTTLAAGLDGSPPAGIAPNSSGISETGALSFMNHVSMSTGSGQFMPDYWKGVAQSQAAHNLSNIAVAGGIVGVTKPLRISANPVAADYNPYGFQSSSLYAFDPKAATTPPPGWLSSATPAFGLVMTAPLLPARRFSTVSGTPWAAATSPPPASPSNISAYIPQSPVGYLLGITPPSSITASMIGDNGYGGP